MKTVFMFAGAENVVHVWLELVYQINQYRDDIQYYMLCEATVNFEKHIQQQEAKNLRISPIYLYPDNIASVNFYKHVHEKADVKGIQLVKNKIKNLNDNNILKIAFDILGILKKIILVYKHKKNTKKILTKYSPDMILFPDGVRPIYELVMIKVAYKKNIPTFLIPFGHIPRPIECVEQKFNMPIVSKKQASGWRVHFISRKYPNQIVNVGDVSISRYSLNDTIAFGLKGILPINPWVIGGNNFTRVGVSMYDYYLESTQKLPLPYSNRLECMHTIEKTAVLSILNNREENKRLLYKKYELSEGNLVVFALEAFAESTFPISYAESIIVFKKIISLLREKYSNILIALHPRMSKEKYYCLEEFPKCKIADERLYKFIVLADLVVGFAEFSIVNILEGISIPKWLIKMNEIYELIDGGTAESLRKKMITAEKQKCNFTYRDDGYSDFSYFITSWGADTIQT